MTGMFSLTKDRVKKALGDIFRLPDGTVAPGDLLVLNDVSDGNKAKKVTAQSVADLFALSASDISGQTEATVAVGDSIVFTDADDGGALKRDTVQGIVDLVDTTPPTTYKTIGTYVLATGSSSIAAGATTAGSNLNEVSGDFNGGTSGATGAGVGAGTWRNMSAPAGTGKVNLWVRTA